MVRTVLVFSSTVGLALAERVPHPFLIMPTPPHRGKVFYEPH